MLTIAVVNLKGGTSKTTTAAHLVHVAHERGQRALLVDADPQRSAVRWSEDGDWPVPVAELSTPDLDRRLPGFTGSRFDVIVIDTPPHGEAIVAAALRAATHVLVTMAPTPAEHERLPVVRELLDSVAQKRRGGPPVVGVLLTRAVTGAASTRAYKTLLGAEGWQVLGVSVRRLERFAQSYGSPVVRAAAGPYGDVLDELVKLQPTLDEGSAR